MRAAREMIARVGWQQVVVCAALGSIYGYEAFAAGFGLLGLVSAVFVTLAIFFGCLGAFHRGRASAFQEAAEMAREVERGRRLAPFPGTSSRSWTER